MKKFIQLSLIFLFISSISQVYAQLAKDSWTFGFGFNYPRSMNTTITRSEENYGGFLSIQRNFTEHVGLRLKASYISLKSTAGAVDVTTNAAVGNLDLLYYFVPCESVSPFIAFGVGYDYMMFDNQIPATRDDTDLDYELNLGFGAEWGLGDDWKLKTEFGYHTVSNGYFDGVSGSSTGGLLGTLEDAYMTFDLGFLVYFGKGQPSKYCQLYEGIMAADMPDPVDYDRIEEIVQKYIPQEVVKEVVVEKPVPMTDSRRWVLVGVNFDFNSSKLRDEAYPILFHAVQVLLQNPDMRIEIQGHTDNIGTEASNKRLSEKRAQAVKDYLVARGVSASRITTVGYGESMPIADNKTAQGRLMNRRIEFKVLN